MQAESKDMALRAAADRTQSYMLGRSGRTLMIRRNGVCHASGARKATSLDGPIAH